MIQQSHKFEMQVYVTRTHDGKTDTVTIKEPFPIVLGDLHYIYREMLLKDNISLIRMIGDEEDSITPGSKWQAHTVSTEEELVTYLDDCKGVLPEALYLAEFPAVRALLKNPSFPVYYCAFCTIRGCAQNKLDVYVKGNDLSESVASPLLQAVKMYNLILDYSLIHGSRVPVNLCSGTAQHMHDTIKTFSRPRTDPVIQRLLAQVQ